MQTIHTHTHTHSYCYIPGMREKGGVCVELHKDCDVAGVSVTHKNRNKKRDKDTSEERRE